MDIQLHGRFYGADIQVDGREGGLQASEQQKEYINGPQAQEKQVDGPEKEEESHYYSSYLQLRPLLLFNTADSPISPVGSVICGLKSDSWRELKRRYKWKTA
jgi:hypothetical protein